jgi:hypothetical protein
MRRAGGLRRQSVRTVTHLISTAGIPAATTRPYVLHFPTRLSSANFRNSVSQVAKYSSWKAEPGTANNAQILAGLAVR